MGIGRRTFLKMFSTAIASIALDPLRSFVIADDLYVNSKLGFSCRKPPGWDFAYAYEFGKLITGPYVDPSDRQLMANIAREAGYGTHGALTLSSEKFSSQDKHIAPAISVLVEHDEHWADLRIDSQQVAQVYADGFLGSLQNAKSCGPAKFLQVSQCNAVRFGFKATFEENGRSHDWLVDQLTIFQGPLNYVISMANPAQALHQFSYEQLIQTIKVA